jgi:hypothetical protein
MARLQQRYRQQARAQARAETQPQIAAKRRGLHAEVAALRSEEDPLTEGLDAATAAIKHSNLSATDKALAVKDFAERQADIPEGITSQINSARELAGGEISDLRTAQAQQSASILASLLAAQATHQQGVQDEIAAEGRQSAGDIAEAQQEKELGLGSYAKTPTEEALEKASLEKLEAETVKTQHEAHGNGLTPYQQLERHETHAEDHDTAALHAKLAFEAAKGELGDPHEWDGSTWQKIAALVEEKGKVPTAAAEKAVGAIRDHFTPPPSDPFGVVGHAAAAAAGALSQPAGAPTSTTGADSLLSLLPQIKHGRY